MRSRRVVSTRWLQAVVAAALGSGASGCAERSIDEGGFAEIGEGESGTSETGTSETGTIPSEPFECAVADVIVAAPVNGDGTCVLCEDDENCWSAAEQGAVDAGYWCDGSCECSVTLVCMAEIQNEEGQCLRGFAIEEWCGEGRPLLAEGEARVAPASLRSDWCGACPQLEIPAGLRARVADAWLARAAMEHASIAAFARFGLQLQALGAPAALIAAAQRAGQDERRHAELCYGVASQLAARDHGPGPLELRGLSLGADPQTVALESILEGCIGETVAAAKMRYLGEHIADPELRRRVLVIAREESEHAALAWRGLKWLLASFPVEAVVRETFARALAAPSSVGPDEDEGDSASLLAHGVLDVATGHAITRAVLREVIAPAAASLLGQGTAPRVAAR